MTRPTLHRVASSVISVLRSHIALPAYVSPLEPFPVESAQLMPANNPLFITARFRSGSTLLWQVFHRLKGFTSYYEPLNERRWFDREHRGDRIDNTHRGVSDYAVNYENLAHLGQFFREDWTYHRLALGSESKEKRLEKYVQAMVEAAPKRPVLQFNRVDFRLPFLKARFPEAKIIHLRREHRDTWRSTLNGAENNQEWTLTSFDGLCRFYLLSWYRDLSLTFPFLWSDPDETHPYEIHYLISRLSELFALRDADVFLDYDELNQDFNGKITTLMNAIGSGDTALSALDGLYEPKPSGYDHSNDDVFYQTLENKVEQRLQQALPLRNT
ncbi:sulfotransferase [Kordiimonas aquimaris]|uniref:sulfotransferase n=1 Tax=Kordiimonas aquimaris TaxID=707591 RepID=UPI0021D244BB|nr:sulfotransferase [Kordiimonas aquimaris]